MSFTVIVQFNTKETLCYPFLTKIRPILHWFHCDGLVLLRDFMLLLYDKNQASIIWVMVQFVTKENLYAPI